MNLRNHKNSLRNTLIFTIIAVLAIGAFFVVYYGFGTNNPSVELTKKQAQKLVNSSIESIPRASAKGAAAIFDNVDIKVISIEDGEGKSYDLNCEYSSYDVKNIIEPELDNIFSDVYMEYITNKNNGKMTNSTKVNLLVKDKFVELLNSSDKRVTGTVVISAFEIEDGVFQLYFNKEIVNTITGGLQDIVDTVQKTETVKFGSDEIDISTITPLRNGIKACVEINDNYSDKPYTGTSLQKAVAEFKDDFYQNFIKAGRWRYLLNGLGTTLALTGLSVVLGVFLGFLVALIRVTNQTTGKLKILDAICRFYLTLFRGTPLMVQLLIIYFIILLPIGVPKFFAAVLCFGFNSGAYVAEIVRGGIMAVDKGQTEAGRSLGFNYSQTMINFIIPQAFKTVLPSLANEFITLLKESSVAFYLGVADLTQAGLKIRSQTFSNFMPLIAVALIYLVLVLILTFLVSLLERRLRKGDH